MKRLLLLLIAAIALTLPVNAQQYVRLIGGDQTANPPVPASASNPVPVTPSSSSASPVYTTAAAIPVANMASVRGTVPNASTVITFPAAVHGVVIWAESDAANLHVNPNGGTSATTSMATLAAGQGMNLPLPSGTTTIAIIGDSATGHYDYVTY